MGAKYQVWWLGGNLNKDEERNRYHQFGNTLAEVFSGVATVIDHFRAHYEFKWEERCTKDRFRELWLRSSTAGLLWHSHGDLSAGAAAAIAYDRSVDSPSAAGRPAGLQALRLIPDDLGPSTRSLRLLGLFHCFSADRQDEWVRATPASTAIVTMNRLVGADWGEKTNANFNAWSWDECRKAGDFAYRKSWKRYREYEEVMKKARRDLRVSKAQAIQNAWQLFKYLVYSGPAGPPPPPPPKWWEMHCSLTPQRESLRSQHAPGAVGLDAQPTSPGHRRPGRFA